MKRAPQVPSATLSAALLFVSVAAIGQAGGDAAEVGEAVARLARMGSAFSPTFSPDGRTVAFVADLSGSPQVWTVPFGGGWPSQVTAVSATQPG